LRQIGFDVCRIAKNFARAQSHELVVSRVARVDLVAIAEYAGPDHHVENGVRPAAIFFHNGSSVVLKNSDEFRVAQHVPLLVRVKLPVEAAHLSLIERKRKAIGE
jgi:hypothetical protein